MSSRLIKFTNNARSTLNGGISNIATAAAVQSGHGTRFPSITGSEYFYATLDDGSGVIEIIKVTARTGDSFGTIARAQEGTVAVAWADGSIIQLRLTEDGMQKFVGEGQELVTRTDLPTNSTVDTGIAYAVGNDRRVTLSGSGDTSQDLFHMDENGLVLRPGAGYAELSDDAHDWSALAAPEIPQMVVLTPTADRIITLPTTKVPIGWAITILNAATTIGLDLIVKASGGARMREVMPGQMVTFVARTKTPTTGAHWYKGDGVWHRDVTAVGSVGAPESDLMTYNLPANCLQADGGAIRVVGHFIGNGTDNVTVKIHFGATNIAFYSANLVANSGNTTLRAELTITRTGAATQIIEGSNGRSVATVYNSFYNTAAEDLTGEITVKFTGQNTSDTSNDAVEQVLMTLEMLN